MRKWRKDWWKCKKNKKKKKKIIWILISSRNPVISSKAHSKDFQKNQILGEKIKRFHQLKEKEEKEYDYEKRKKELEAIFYLFFQKITSIIEKK